MAIKNNPEVVTLRTPRGSTVISDLMKLAEADNGRSLNNYVFIVLNNHVKSKKIKLSKIK